MIMIQTLYILLNFKSDRQYNLTDVQCFMEFILGNKLCY